MAAGPKFIIFQDKKGDWRWKLVAMNGETVAMGEEPFSSKQSVTRSIESVRNNAAKAEIVEE